MYKKTVLIVEDEKLLLDSTALLLSEWFKVLKAADGEEALELIGSSLVDCVVLDIEMPRMGGVELLKRLRELLGSVPVIVVTGRSTLASAERCADLAVAGYINKPYDIELLVERITAATASYLPTRMTGPNDGEHPKLKEALDYINGRYHEPISMKSISTRLGISGDYLARLFAKQLGVSLTTYLNRLRVERAKALLETTDLKVAEVMEKVGFATEQHFYKQFRKYAGATPSKFRAR